VEVLADLLENGASSQSRRTVMGWISSRSMRTGTGIGRGSSGKSIKDNGPLRKIKYLIEMRPSIFDRDLVMLECGHEVFVTGQFKGRCYKCKQEALDA
jgi:hypothetical protein